MLKMKLKGKLLKESFKIYINKKKKLKKNNLKNKKKLTKNKRSIINIF